MRVIQLPIDGNGNLWGASGVVPRVDGRMYHNGALWYSVQTTATAPTFVGQIVPPTGDNGAVGGGYKVNNHKLCGFTPDGCPVIVFESPNPANGAQWGVFAGVLGPTPGREPGGTAPPPPSDPTALELARRIAIDGQALVKQLGG